jgi:hypothetical protein
VDRLNIIPILPGVRNRLIKAHPAVLALYAGVAAFTAYACMYGFRKPFTAGTYAGLQLWGIDYKIVLVIAQVGGYALSKFIGIRVISSMGNTGRATMLLLLIGIAHLALLGFALTPFPYKAVWLFVNGIPLGMIWGIVFGYLEGRRITEVLAAAISVNFIISSGLVKSLGKSLLENGTSNEWWMPFITGLFFIPALLLAVWMLEQLPPPSAADRELRSPREKMSAGDRRALWAKYEPGFIILILGYMLLTMMRDVRDNFAVEIWSELGFSGQPAILTTAELPVAVLVLVGLGALMLVKNNFKALWLNHLICVMGAVLLIGSTAVFQYQLISPVVWMILSGVGLFMPYIIFNGMLFERMLAAFKEKANVGFLIYMADAFGYLSSVLILLWRNFGFSEMSWLTFYRYLCYIGSAVFIGLLLTSLVYFRNKKQFPKKSKWKTNLM